MTTVSEIAPDLFRISTFVPDFNLQFNQFLVRDAEPLLFHTGPRGEKKKVPGPIVWVSPSLWFCGETSISAKTTGLHFAKTTAFDHDVSWGV
jgi:hypothetical protein